MRTLSSPRLLAVSAILSIAFLPLALFGHSAAATTCKVGSIALLLVITLLSTQTAPLLVGALAFSAIGDFFLEFRQLGPFGQEKLFLFGLVAFLAAHLSYIGLFVRHRSPFAVTAARRLGTIVVILGPVVLFNVLWRNLGSMQWPVVVYALALMAMAATAQQSGFRGLVAVGAVLFVASDSMLAWEHFRAPFNFAGPLIWLSYYVAQAFITLGVIQAKSPAKAGLN